MWRCECIQAHPTVTEMLVRLRELADAPTDALGIVEVAVAQPMQPQHEFLSAMWILLLSWCLSWWSIRSHVPKPVCLE